MSVGVCIINRNGIALATDSAGTLTGNKMVYNSMNKLFSLSNEKPFGAITYGSSALFHVSIDQILKEFAIYLNNKKILDFFDILTNFTDFIKEKNQYYKFVEGEKILCTNLIKALVDDWGNRIKNIINEDDAKQKVNIVLGELKFHINSCNPIAQFDVSKYISEQYKTVFEDFVDGVVPELKAYTDEKELFWELISNYFNLPIKSETDNKTGLFFAGYGEEDAFPKFIRIDIYTIINGQLKFSLIEKFEESCNAAKIVPLAQEEVIMTFCKGISENFINYIPLKVDEIISRKINSLQSDYTQEQLNKLKERFNDCKNEISNSINILAREENINPLLASVLLIPISEMATLAENLINITSLKRTFSLDGNQQTVGGPTDVAIITKPDGFLWIKKKQINKI